MISILEEDDDYFYQVDAVFITTPRNDTATDDESGDEEVEKYTMTHNQLTAEVEVRQNGRTFCDEGGSFEDDLQPIPKQKLHNWSRCKRNLDYILYSQILSIYQRLADCPSIREKRSRLLST